MKKSHRWLLVALMGCSAAQTAAPETAPLQAEVEPTSQSAAAGETSGEPVALKFDWQPGLRLRFEEEIKQGDESTRSSRTVEVLADTGGLRLVSSDIDPGMGASPANVPAKVSQVLHAIIAKAYPVVFLKPDGTLIDAKAEKFDMEGMVAGLKKEDDRQAVTMMAGMLAAGAQMHVRESWQNLVSDWAGATLVRGKPLASKGTVMAGLAGEIPVRVENVLVGRVPCSEGAAPNSCVHVRQTKTSDQRGEGKARIAMTLDLVTEPDTLIPHSFKMAATTTMTIDMGGGPHETTAQSTMEGRYTVLP